jgi:hypothetical protein
MYGSIKAARVNDKFQDSLYLFLELVRAGVMHGNLWSGRAYSGGPSFGTGELIKKVFEKVESVADLGFPTPDEEKRSMLLIMRVLSIVPLNFKVRIVETFDKLAMPASKKKLVDPLAATMVWPTLP